MERLNFFLLTAMIICFTTVGHTQVIASAEVFTGENLEEPIFTSTLSQWEGEDLTMNQPVDKKGENSPWTIQPLNINSNMDEISPYVGPEGLFFTRVSSSESGECTSEIMATVGEESHFQNIRPWETRISTSKNFSNVAYSPSGSKVLLTKINDSNCYDGLIPNEGMSILEAEVNPDGSWENIKALPFNSIEFDAGFATYGESDDEMYFSSNRPDGFGGFDIFHSKRLEDGSWSKARNLGPEINSEFNEITPKVNGEVLAYSSNNTSDQQYNIFFSAYSDFDFNQAEAASGDLNSLGDDWNLIFIDQESGYFVSNRNQKQADIFYFDLLNNQPKAQLVSDKRPSKSKSAGESSAKSLLPLAIPADWNEERIQSWKNTDPENIKTLYSIQIATLSKGSKNINKLTKQLSDLARVYKIYFEDVVKIRLGSYDSEIDAVSLLPKVKERGYKDAFIVREKMIVPEEELEKEPVSNAKVANEGQIIYKLRLATYLHPENFSAEKVKHLGQISNLKKGPYTIYLLGAFSSLEKAKNALGKVQEIGFTNAQIIIQNGDDLKRVE